MLWVIAASVLSWLALLLVSGGAFVAEFTAGMAGPLVVSTVNWALVSRTFRANPAHVQSVMIRGLIAKLVLFCAYVVIMIRGVGLRPAPFALSFVGYFVVLYATQAVFMRRLFLSGSQSPA
jgi:hypothetical protein